MVRIYYLDAEYETGKHRIMKIWTEGALPEDNPLTAINVPYSVLEVDEEYNPDIWDVVKYGINRYRILARYYIDNEGNIRKVSDDSIFTIVENPNKEGYKLSLLYNKTWEQVENYILNNTENLSEARDYLIELSHVVYWIVKQIKLE